MRLIWWSIWLSVVWCGKVICNVPMTSSHGKILQVGGPAYWERMSKSELRANYDSHLWHLQFINRRLLPHIAKHTVGVVAVGSRRYIDWLEALHRSVTISDSYGLLQFISRSSTPISSDMLPSLLGPWRSGSVGIPSSIVGRMRRRLLKVCTS